VKFIWIIKGKIPAETGKKERKINPFEGMRVSKHADERMFKTSTMVVLEWNGEKSTFL
jgi:hypothetical protein